MIFVISRKWPFREPEVGLKWPLGRELGVEVEVNGVALAELLLLCDGILTSNLATDRAP